MAHQNAFADVALVRSEALEAELLQGRPELDLHAVQLVLGEQQLSRVHDQLIARLAGCHVLHQLIVVGVLLDLAQFGVAFRTVACPVIVGAALEAAVAGRLLQLLPLFCSCSSSR